MKTWTTVDGPIDETDLSSIIAELQGMGAAPAFHLAVFMGWLKDGLFSDRRIDRALQLLKRQGRIRYDHHGRKWVAVGGGER